MGDLVVIVSVHVFSALSGGVGELIGKCRPPSPPQPPATLAATLGAGLEENGKEMKNKNSFNPGSIVVSIRFLLTQ